MSGGITTSAGVSGFAAVSADEDMVIELGHKSSLMDGGFVVADCVLMLSESSEAEELGAEFPAL